MAETPTAAEERDDENEDSVSRGCACSDAELMNEVFLPFFTKPDWLQRRSDLAKHPSKADQTMIKPLVPLG
eukprot:5569684-Pyramimonas_sp.AAC.1